MTWAPDANYKAGYGAIDWSVPLSKTAPPPRPQSNRADLPAPRLILDTMDALPHPITGEVLDSKSAFRARTKAAGGVELGNEKPKPRLRPKMDKRKRADDIKKAIYDLRNGRKP